MLFLVQNRLLTQNRERTYLTAAVASTGTSLTVKAVDSNAWSDNNWIIVGEIGTPTAEVLQINGAVTDGTTLTVDNAGSGGCRFAHGVDEPVYAIDFNKIQVYRATAVDETKSLLATIEVQPDDYESRYDDQSNSTGYGFVRFLNSFTSGTSQYSDAIPYEGQQAGALSSLIDKVRSLTDEDDDAFISDAEIVDAINDAQREVIHSHLWSFNTYTKSHSRVANQFAYNVPSTCRNIATVRVATEPLAVIPETKWEMFGWKTNANSQTQTHCTIQNGQILVYPQPASGAASTTLNGAISAGSTTITVADGTGFSRGDYYRFIIDSEVIYATGQTATSFTGCMRGQEGTTAASHLDAAEVTERDVVYTGQLAAVSLTTQNDVTIIPEPRILALGAAMDIAVGKLKNNSLYDRLKIKYDAALEDLKGSYALKFTSQFPRVHDMKEVISDDYFFRNPNDYPQNVQTF